jgi:hypothetical protein
MTMTYADTVYDKYQKLFKKFIENIKSLKDKIPFLEFNEQTDTRIALNYQRRPCSIQLDYTFDSKGNVKSKLVGTAIDNKIISISMEESGVVHLTEVGGKVDVNISIRPFEGQYNPCETVFCALLGITVNS